MVRHHGFKAPLIHASRCLGNISTRDDRGATHWLSRLPLEVLEVCRLHAQIRDREAFRPHPCLADKLKPRFPHVGADRETETFDAPEMFVISLQRHEVADLWCHG